MKKPNLKFGCGCSKPGMCDCNMSMEEQMKVENQPRFIIDKNNEFGPSSGLWFGDSNCYGSNDDKISLVSGSKELLRRIPLFNRDYKKIRHVNDVVHKNWSIIETTIAIICTIAIGVLIFILS